MYALGIDLGTTFTAAATWRNGHAEIASLGSRAAAIPSVVLLRADETFVTGETANRRGLSEPHRVAREFKRRLGDTTPILLGGVPYSAEALMARLLRSVVDEVGTREGGAPSAICVSHPANWGPYKTDLLRQAVRMSGLEQPVTLTTEPEAAAAFYAQQQRIEPGAVVAVYDLGGGTFDAAVLRKTTTGFEILGQPEGIERLGGIDFDAAVFSHVAKALGPKLSELDEDDPAVISAVARLRDEVTQAKEALSSDTDATIPVLLPNVTTEVRITRAEFESMVRPALYDSIEALKRALRSAGVTADQLHSVLLVGGSSRMPIVSQLVGAELGRPVAVDAHPKHAVALGAAWLASGQTASVAAAPPVTTRPPVTVPPPVTVTPPVTVMPQSPPAPSTLPPTSPPVTPTPARPASPVPSVSPLATQSGAHPTVPYRGSASVQADAATLLPGAVPTAGVHAAPTEIGGMPAYGTPAAPPLPPTGKSSTLAKRPMLIAGGLVLVAIIAAVAVTLSNLGNGGGGTPNGADHTQGIDQTTGAASTEAAVPAYAQCTDEIKANKRWVCLTSAVFDGDKLVINYDSSWGGPGEPNIRGDFHVHFYAAKDADNPPETTMGAQFPKHGRWYIDDQNPSVTTAGTSNFGQIISGSGRPRGPLVCARVANGRHELVEDETGNGTYHTGNCVKITEP
jgi:actin-like ATPase involved in cell morphogenesis